MKPKEQKLRNYIADHKEEIIADIIRLVKAESPSRDKAAADACARELASLYHERLGARSQFVPNESVGDNLVTEIGDGSRTLMIVGHYDTVHPLGAVPIRREGDKLYGPGVTDMKSGDISVIWALKALRETGVALDKKILIVNDSDEEIMSHHSRALLLKKAQEAYACIIAEPAVRGSGKIKASRKGHAAITIKCWGKAAHSGSNPGDGVNANVELCHQVLFTESLSDMRPGGTTFCATVVSGGSRDNVVSDYAEAKVDWRVSSPEDLARFKKIFAERKAVLPGAKVEYDIVDLHPPFPDNEASRKLYAVLEGAAADLDMTIEAAHMVGGCSDGNFIAASGVPVIDGLGCVGNFMHTPQEELYLDSIVPRISLLASFISRV